MDGTETRPRTARGNGHGSDWITELDESQSEESSSSGESGASDLAGKARPTDTAQPRVRSRAPGPGASAELPASPPAARPATPIARTPEQSIIYTPEQRRQIDRGRKALIRAAKTGDVPALERLLETDAGTAQPGGVQADMVRVYINRPDGKGLSAWLHAASRGQNGALRTLLRHGADPDATSPLGYTALMLAASHQRGSTVELLLDLGAPERHADPGARPAAPAAEKNIHQYAVDASRHAALPESERQEAFCQAVMRDDLPMAARMLATGMIDPEYIDEGGHTLLVHAARLGGAQMIRLLLCARADANAPDDAGNSPLMHAVAAKQVQAMEALLQGGGSIEQRNREGDSALTLAVRSDRIGVMQALVDGRAQLWRNERGAQALLAVAAREECRTMARELVKVKVDQPDENGSRTLAVLAKNGETAAVEVLLAAGDSPDHRAHDGHTAFTLAAANGHVGVANALLEHCRASEPVRHPRPHGAHAGRA